MEFRKEWISNQLDASAIQWAEEKGRDYASILTTSQIRKFFGALRGLELKADENQQQLLLLKPKLAYAIARIKKKPENKNNQPKLDKFFEEFGKALDSVQVANKQTLNNFIGLFEAFVAYHKFHGGRD